MFTRAELAMAAGVGVIAFLVYLKTLAPTLAAGDSGDFIVTAATLGVAHPPGYPLYTMLAELFILLPIGDPAYRLNLLSALLHAAAASVTSLCVVRLWPRSAASADGELGGTWLALIGAAAGGLLLAFFPPVWKYAIVAEVFALNTLFAALLLLLLVIWSRQPGRRGPLLLFGLTCGLAASNHHTIVLLGPAFVVLLVHGYRRLNRRQRSMALKTAVAAAGLTGVGLLAYLYLPIAAAGSSSHVWGDPLTTQGFWRLVTRGQYGSFQLTAGAASGSPLVHLGLYLESLINGFSPIGVILAGAGWWWLRRRQSDVALALLLAWAISGPAFIMYAKPPFDNPVIKGVIERFYMMSGVPFAIAIGAGVHWIAIAAQNKLSMSRQRSLALGGLAAALAGLVIVIPALHLPGVDQSENYVTRDYGRDMLAPLEPRSILITRGDIVTLPVLYLTLVEKYRADVIVLDVELMKERAYVARQLRAHPDLVIPFTAYDEGRTASLSTLIEANLPYRAVYTRGSFTNSDLPTGFDRVRAGLATQLLPLGSGVNEWSILRSKPDLFLQTRYPTQTFPDAAFEWWITTNEYMRLAQNVAYAIDRDRPQEAIELYRTAIRLNPGFPSSYKNLGALMLQQRLDPNEAAGLLETHLQFVPNDPDAPVLRQAIALARAGRPVPIDLRDAS